MKQVTPSWVTVSIDTAPDAGTSNFAVVWPATGTLAAGLTDGQYLFRVIVTDNAGNQRVSASVAVTVDTTRPVVTITAPVPNSGLIAYTEDSKPTFTATATDPAAAGQQASGIANVQFYYAVWTETGKPTTWSGFTLLSTDTTAEYAASYPVAGLPEGRYIFATRAVDVVGNDSPLLDGPAYAAGVTQEVIIDSTAPVLTITGPYPGASVEENKVNAVTITWTLVDVTRPDTVKIEYTLDASAAVPVWTPLENATPNDGSYQWTTPDVVGDKTHVKIRITAVDKAGAVVGDIPGHTTSADSGEFTVYDLPEPVTGLIATDPDTVAAGIDGRDFHAAWTVSTSADIVSQKVYILPAAVTTLDLGADHPVATIANNTTSSWTGEASLLTDSQYITLHLDTYRIWIVVTDTGGRVALIASNPFSVGAP